MSIVGIDVGGTFTDFVIFSSDGKMRSYKILSTPANPELALIEGLRRVEEQINSICHATTIGTNALLGQEGLGLPGIGLITTKGFKDVIEIGRQNRPNLYDLEFKKPKVLVDREARMEIEERVDARGRIVKELRVIELQQAARKLVDLNVKTVAICFLHSYLNPENEKTAKRLLEKSFEYVSISSEVAPEPRESERTHTVVLNAALTPIITKYLKKLEIALVSFSNPNLHIMSSSGGWIDVEEAIKRPVQMIESGPAAGVIAASEFCRLCGIPRLISFDMGGTTAKAGTVIDYSPEIVSEYEVGGDTHHGRILKGSGYPVLYPFIDLAEVSAGGGTIIWKDGAESLHVGPLSVGSDPGPACYGLGGNQPTLTDANVVLGRIGSTLLGGEIKLSEIRATEAFSTLGDPVEIADSSIKLANLQMSRAIRLVTIERGLDPSEFGLMAFGGAGPQHAADIAHEIGVTKVIIPNNPSVFSATGMIFSSSKFEARMSFPSDLEVEFEQLESSLLRRTGSHGKFLRYADVRYLGQGWELMIPVRRPTSNPEIKDLFEKKHRQVYGFNLTKEIEIVLIRVFAISPYTRRMIISDVPGCNVDSVSGTRKVYFDEWLDTPVYLRSDLGMDFKAKGPAVIEEYGTSTVVPPDWRIEKGEFDSIVMSK